VLAERTTEAGGWELEVLVPCTELDRLLHRDPSVAERLACPDAETPVQAQA
jgi:hypothetical protein